MSPRSIGAVAWYFPIVAALKKVLLPGLLALLVACDSEFSRNAALGNGPDTLRIALSADIRTTEPGVLRDGNTDDVLMHVIEPLVTYREDLTVTPLLLSSWAVAEDGLSYLLHLREDVRFHNGQLLTPELVVWNFERYLNPETGWLCLRIFDGSRGLKIERVTQESDRVVRIELNQRDSAFMHKLANTQCNLGIVHPDSLDPGGQWRSPVGTGPYQLSRWKQGEFVELQRHASYRPLPDPRDGLGGSREPLVEHLRWVVVPEASAMRAGLLSGQLDVIYKLQVADLFDLTAASDVVVHRDSSLDWDALLLQDGHGPLADMALRRAIAHAIDPQQLAEIITDGVSRANNAVVSEHSSFYSGCMTEGYAYDLDLARSWLGRSSYDGRALKLMANKRFPSMYENAIIVQHMLGQVGIRIELDIVEWTTQLDYYARGDFELMSFGFTGRTHPVLNYEAILGSKAHNPMYQWDDPIGVAMLDRVSQSDNREVINETLCKLHRRMIDAVPIVNLFNHHTIDAHRANIQGYQATAFNKPRLWGVRKTAFADRNRVY